MIHTSCLLEASRSLEITHFIIYCLRLCSLSSPPTLSNSWCWLNTLPPPTLWLTAQNPANDPYKLELMQYSCHSVCFLPLGWTHILGFIQILQLTLVLDSSLLPAGLLSVPACLGVLSDEDPSVVPGGAVGMSLYPWTQWLPGGMCGLRAAPAAAAAAATSLQHHGEHMCVSLLVVVSHCW